MSHNLNSLGGETGGPANGQMSKRSMADENPDIQFNDIYCSEHNKILKSNCEHCKKLEYEVDKKSKMGE